MYNGFMDLGNSIETIVHHFLIGGMICFGCRDGFPYDECTSICDAHWIGPMMNHDARLLIIIIHQATILHGL